MKNVYKILFFLILTISVNQLHAKVDSNNSINEKKTTHKSDTYLASPSATITSSASSVCKDGATSPTITFTGTGGTAPYVFTYKINNGPNLTTDASTSDVITLYVPTTVAGTFIYTLISVHDAALPMDEISLTDSVTIEVYTLPTISGTLNTCIGSNASLSGSGTANGTTPWESSDPLVATVNNSGLVTGISAGTTTITYTNNNGCSVSKTFTVNSPPTVDFTFTNNNQCSGTSVQFNTTSTGVTYTWNFGDGNSSTERNPTHVFNNTNGNEAQSFSTTLTLTDANGCKNSITKLVSIKSPSTSLNSNAESGIYNGFPIFKVCTNNVSTIKFVNTSTTKSTNANYEINWGDSSDNYISDKFNVPESHTYSVGLWTLTYTITSNSGCSITREYKVFVGNNPAVGIVNPGNTNVCINTPLTFPITGTENNPPGTIYTVTFNDDSAPKIFNHPPPDSITHTFSKSSCGINSVSGTSSIFFGFGSFFIL